MGTGGVNHGEFFSRKRIEMKQHYGGAGRTSGLQNGSPSIFDYSRQNNTDRTNDASEEFLSAAEAKGRSSSGNNTVQKAPSETKIQMQQLKQLQDTANQALNTLNSNLAAKEQQFQQLGSAIEAFKQQNQPRPEQFKKDDGTVDENKYNSAMEKFVNDNKSKTQQYQKLQQEITNIKTEISKLKNQASAIEGKYTEIETKSFEEDYQTAANQRKETAAKQDNESNTIMGRLKQMMPKNQTAANSSAGTGASVNSSAVPKNTDGNQSLDDMKFRSRQLKYNYKKLQEEVKNPSNQSETYKKLTEQALNETRQELSALYKQIRAAKQK